VDAQPLRYNQRSTLLAPRFIAQADPCINYLEKLIGQLRASISIMGLNFILKLKGRW
tara:strand:- start:424 stop:594 length:171 start_codon:yes stop_codon:yes gene_type:complete